MKIYNKIIWQWNEETQQLEEVYEDSFDYNGHLDLASDEFGDFQGEPGIGLVFAPVVSQPCSHGPDMGPGNDGEFNFCGIDDYLYRDGNQACAEEYPSTQDNTYPCQDIVLTQTDGSTIFMGEYADYFGNVCEYDFAAEHPDFMNGIINIQARCKIEDQNYQDEPVFGCMQKIAANYNFRANRDDGSCILTPVQATNAWVGGDCNGDGHVSAEDILFMGELAVDTSWQTYQWANMSEFTDSNPIHTIEFRRCIPNYLNYFENPIIGPEQIQILIDAIDYAEGDYAVGNYNQIGQNVWPLIGACAGANSNAGPAQAICPITGAGVCAGDLSTNYYQDCPLPEEQNTVVGVGCTDQFACNYNPDAVFTDNSQCVLPEAHCLANTMGYPDYCDVDANGDILQQAVYCPIGDYVFNDTQPGDSLPFVTLAPEGWIPLANAQIDSNEAGCTNPLALNVGDYNFTDDAQCLYCPDGYVDLVELNNHLDETSIWTTIYPYVTINGQLPGVGDRNPRCIKETDFNALGNLFSAPGSLASFESNPLHAANGGNVLIDLISYDITNQNTVDGNPLSEPAQSIQWQNVLLDIQGIEIFDEIIPFIRESILLLNSLKTLVLTRNQTGPPAQDNPSEYAWSTNWNLGLHQPMLETLSITSNNFSNSKIPSAFYQSIPVGLNFLSLKDNGLEFETTDQPIPINIVGSFINKVDISENNFSGTIGGANYQNLENKICQGYMANSPGKSLDISNNHFCLSSEFPEFAPYCLEEAVANNEDAYISSGDMGVKWVPQTDIESFCQVNCPPGYTNFEMDYINSIPNTNLTFDAEADSFGDVCIGVNDLQFLQDLLNEQLKPDNQTYVLSKGYSPVQADNPFQIGHQVWGTPELVEQGSLFKLIYFDSTDNGGGKFTGEVPDSIGALENLEVLDLSDNFFFGTLPMDIGLINSSVDGMATLFLNDNEFSGVIPTSICNLPMSENNLKLQGNSLCPPYPYIANNMGDTACLAAEEETESVFWERHLKFFEIDDNGEVSMGPQFPQDATQCQIPGCTSEAAENYNPMAQIDDGSCIYDGYLHFPWSNFEDGRIETAQDSEGNTIIITGDYGEGMSTIQMIEALHSKSGCGYRDDCPEVLISGDSEQGTYETVGYQYNSLSDLDLDNNGIINELDMNLWFSNADPVTYQGSPVDAEGVPYCIPANSGPTEVFCLGDARPYEFLKRVYNLIAQGSPAQQFIDSYFPIQEIDISMFNFEYFEDYDFNNDGNLDAMDITLWRQIGRNDIANLINQMIKGQLDIPLKRPEIDDDGIADSYNMVSMSYSKDFYYEETLQAVDVNTGEETFIPVWEGYEQQTQITKNRINPFSGNSNSLKGETLFTSSMDSRNKKYYFGVADGDPDSSSTLTQFHVSWGHYAGSGSLVAGDSHIGASQAIYKQYASMLLDNKDYEEGGFFISSGSDVNLSDNNGNKDEWIYVLNFKQSGFKDNIQAGSWTLRLSGSHGNSAKTIELTDDSQLGNPPLVKDVGRIYNIVSGSRGDVVPTPNLRHNRYGLFYPDMGIMVLGERVSHEMKSGSMGNGILLPGPAVFNANQSGSRQLYPATGSLEDGKNALRLVNCMKLVGGSNSIVMFGEKETTDKYYACRIKPSEFNFTSNPSILSSSGNFAVSENPGLMNEFTVSGSYTGNDGIEYVSGDTTMGGNQHTYITQVNLFNGMGNCVATATLSKPLKNSFEKEVVIKVKLSY